LTFSAVTLERSSSGQPHELQCRQLEYLQKEYENGKIVKKRDGNKKFINVKKVILPNAL